MSILVYEPAPEVSAETLEDELTRAFESMRAALSAGDAVVVSLDERHVQAVDDPAHAALTHGLIGLTRALAVEGRKPGWRIAALSSPVELPPDERMRWVEHLAGSAALAGSLVRLGGEHLGRIPT